MNSYIYFYVYKSAFTLPYHTYMSLEIYFLLLHLYSYYPLPYTMHDMRLSVKAKQPSSRIKVQLIWMGKHKNVLSSYIFSISKMFQKRIIYVKLFLEFYSCSCSWVIIITLPICCNIVRHYVIPGNNIFHLGSNDFL